MCMKVSPLLKLLSKADSALGVASPGFTNDFLAYEGRPKQTRIPVDNAMKNKTKKKKKQSRLNETVI